MGGRILELCAGYGGLGMAVEALTGGKVAYVADSDEAASKVLALRYPQAPNIGDITGYDWSRLAGQVDIVTAGFSCQDISNAGPREGIGGKRSRVWKDVAEAVRVLRPRLVFLENVAAIRSRGLDVVAADLAAIGYDLRWTCLRASDVGAAHHRDRWFGLAYPHGPGLEVGGVEPAWGQLQAAERSGALAEDTDGEPGSELLRPAPRQAAGGGHGPTLDDEVSFLLSDTEGVRRPSRGAEPAQQQGEVRRLAGRRGEPASDPDGVGRDGRPGDESGPQGRDEPADARYSPAGWWGDFLPAVRRQERLSGRAAPAPTEVGPRGGRRLTARFAEWLMWLPAGWVTDVPGLTRAQQLHKLGNGAVPPQAYAAYHHLLTEHFAEQRHERAA